MKSLIPVEKLLDAGSFLFGMTPETITGPSRKARIFHARSAIALAARCAGYSYPKIGEALGSRDHRAAMNACDRAERFYRDNPEYKRRCEMLIGMARKFQEASNDNETATENGSAAAGNECAAIL